MIHKENSVINVRENKRQSVVIMADNPARENAANG